MGVYPRGREDGARIGSCKLKGQTTGRRRCACGEDLGHVCRPCTHQQLGSQRRQLCRMEVDADVDQLRSFGLCSLAHSPMVRGDVYGLLALRPGTVVVQVDDRHVAASDRSSLSADDRQSQLDIVVGSENCRGRLSQPMASVSV